MVHQAQSLSHVDCHLCSVTNPWGSQSADGFPNNHLIDTHAKRQSLRRLEPKPLPSEPVRVQDPCASISGAQSLHLLKRAKMLPKRLARLTRIGDTIACDAEGCVRIYQGKYAKKSLERHRVRKHGSMYQCKRGCNQTIIRAGYRIKHDGVCDTELQVLRAGS